MTKKDVASLPEEWLNAIAALNKFTMEVDSLFSEMAKTLDATALSVAMVDMHGLKASIALVYDTAAKVLADSMGSIPEINLPDGTKIEKKVGSDRKTWQHIPLAQHVASRIGDMAVDMETGEITMTPQEMVVKLLDYCAPSYWRVKELAKIGISADRFCELSEAKTNIVIRRAK